MSNFFKIIFSLKKLLKLCGAAFRGDESFCASMMVETLLTVGLRIARLSTAILHNPRHSHQPEERTFLQINLIPHKFLAQTGMIYISKIGRGRKTFIL
jgi:hypothetical protein